MMEKIKCVKCGSEELNLTSSNGNENTLFIMCAKCGTFARENLVIIFPRKDNDSYFKNWF